MINIRAERLIAGDIVLLGGLPTEARVAILKAVSAMERFSDDPSPRKEHRRLPPPPGRL